MRGRWFALTLALVPVMFIPTCVAVRQVMVAIAKRPVRGETASSEFAVLIVNGRVPEIVAYASHVWRRANVQLLVPQPERDDIMRAAARLNGGERIATVAIISPPSAGMQSVYVAVHREVAMGTMLFESWYDTDGKRIYPRFERQYSPSMTIVESAVLGVPLSIVVAIIGATLLMRANVQWTPPADGVRAIVLMLLFAAACWMLDDRTSGMFRRFGVPIAWLVFWVAVAYAAWFARWTRWQRLGAFATIVALATTAFVTDQPRQADGVMIISLALAGLVAGGIAVSVVVEACLSAALRLARN